MREFHIRRTARERHAIDDALLSARGDLVVADLAAIRHLAARMNSVRPAGAPSVGAGEIVALGLLHEIAHLLTARFETLSAGSMAGALREVRRRLGEADADLVLDRFASAFPGVGPEPEPAVDRLEEVLLIRVANENPALGPLRELVDDRILRDGTRYDDLAAALEAWFAAGEGLALADGTRASLVELLRAPARRVPTSLAGQLRYVREHWAAILGADLDAIVGRLDIAIGVLAEEERGLHLRFGGGGGKDVPPDVPSFAAAVVADEAEAFSSDSDWMPRVVLMAKSTYVWLDQLSRRYGRDLRTLDAIPDEELDTLASWGVTSLWLIGLWQRSVASERIKRMRGNPDAVASAYSLDDYRIADDLGGEAAYANLRDRAWARGIRLASDMVPNHMGIDSRWVTEHPEWFLSLPEPPFPAYTYTGPDLSHDSRVGIVLEDHYWDDTDAAVVFKRFDRETGDVRYVYHGNDGTSFPWNDTAQLDFLSAEVREHVIGVILDVARRFPVIRFDAAMVLARKHIQRLWWPLPGGVSGDSIPSRAQYAISQEEFDRRMPNEFWREVVDRVAAEVPDTLLLAEAFWMLEGYFVRTLGMHRVYNSAFMHMLRDENGTGYRKLIRETLEFDPEILKRYVNFMSNPDEETALEQFGTGDKYFGVATVMATLPGLPMIGHGQVEGYAEKYGMEFRRARLDEQPDPSLVERHQREVFPLLHRRGWFAEAHDFLLYDLVTDGGGVDESVLAYSNGTGPTRSLVIYHTKFGSTAGTIRDSTAYARKSASGAKRLVRRSLAEGLGLTNDPAMFTTFRDARTGLQYIRSSREVWEHGLWLSLDAYQGHVFWEFDEVRDGSAGQWRRLAERLGGAGVPSLDDALVEQQLEPVHAPLRAVFEGGQVAAVIDGSARRGDVDVLEERLGRLLAAVAGATGVGGDPSAVAGEIRDLILEALPSTRDAADGESLARDDRAALLLYLAMSRFGALAPGADAAATSLAWYDELRLAPVVAAGLRPAGLDDTAASAVVATLRALLALPRPSGLRGRGRQPELMLLERWLASEPIRDAMGVHVWDGEEWLDRDRFASLLAWVWRLDAIETGTRAGPTRRIRLLMAANEAGDHVDRLRAALSAPPATAARTRSTSRRATRPRAGS